MKKNAILASHFFLYAGKCINITNDNVNIADDITRDILRFSRNIGSELETIDAKRSSRLKEGSYICMMIKDSGVPYG